MNDKQRIQLVIYIIVIFMLFSNPYFQNIFFYSYNLIFQNNSVQNLESNTLSLFGQFLLASIFAIIVLLLLG